MTHLFQMTTKIALYKYIFSSRRKLKKTVKDEPTNPLVLK